MSAVSVWLSDAAAVVGRDGAGWTHEFHGARPHDIWHAFECATADLSGPVSELRVRCTSPRLAIWDAETSGSPVDLLGADEVGGLAAAQPHTWALLGTGRYLLGTLDSYLVARLTRGTWHVTTDPRAWPVPEAARPDVVATGSRVGRTEPSVLHGLDVPIVLTD